MTFPKRIVDGNGNDEVDSISRELLGSLSPSTEQRDELFGRVMMHAGVATAAATAAATVTQTASGSAASKAALGKAAWGLKSALAKWTVTLAVAAPLAAGAGYVALKSTPGEALNRSTVAEKPAHADASRAHEPKETSPPASPQTPPPVSAQESDPKQPQDQGPAHERSSPRAAAPALESSLSEEDRLVRRARAEWKAGESDAALSTLAEIERRFPQGVLVQEREMLKIQILRKQGSVKKADSEAGDFKKRYPDSPY